MEETGRNERLVKMKKKTKPNESKQKRKKV